MTLNHIRIVLVFSLLIVGTVLFHVFAYQYKCENIRGWSFWGERLITMSLSLFNIFLFCSVFDTQY